MSGVGGEALESWELKRERDAALDLLTGYGLKTGTLVERVERVLNTCRVLSERIAALEWTVAATAQEISDARAAVRRDTQREDADAETIQRLRTRISDLTGETAFLAQRVAWHLAHGCDTAAKARELALAEWGVGVMGGGA